MPENWHCCYTSIHRQRTSDPANHRDKHTVVGVKQKDDEAGKEQKQGEVYQGRHCFNYPTKMHLVHAMSKKGAHSSSRLWAVSCPPRNPDVVYA